MIQRESLFQTSSDTRVVRAKPGFAERSVLERSLPWLWLALSIGWAVTMYRSDGPDWIRSLLQLL